MRKPHRTSVTVYLLDEWMSTHRVELQRRQSYELLITKFIKSTLGDISLPKFQRLGPQPLERFYVDLLRCDRRLYVEHHPRCERHKIGINPMEAVVQTARTQAPRPRPPSFEDTLPEFTDQRVLSSGAFGRMDLSLYVIESANEA